MSLVWDDTAFQAGLRLALKEYQLVAEHAVDQDAASIRDRAAALAPVATADEDADPGKLRDNVRVDAGQHELNTYHVDVGVDSSVVDYALDVEFGTSKMAPEPFMRPAIAEVEARPSTGL